jgi:hypothetical protein
VHFTSSDPKASLPANYTFTGLVLRKKGHQKITIKDTLHPALTGSAIVDVL